MKPADFCITANASTECKAFLRLFIYLHVKHRNYLGETNLSHGIQPLDYIICVPEVETSCLK